jgi:peptide/nickel transport system substrate-binding protein
MRTGFRRLVVPAVFAATALGTIAIDAVRPTPAAAADLIVGVPQGPTTLDPHHFATPPNNEMSDHLYEPLVAYDPENKLIPALATAWRNLDATTWEFDLRRGVAFHDGTSFVAADLAYSVERARRSTGPSPMSQYVRDIERVDVVDDHKVRVVTKGPFPLVLDYLAKVPVLHRGLGTPGTADFDTGRAAIGTGPFRFAEFVPGDRTVYRRNDAYWRKPSDFERVVFRVMPNAASREAALLAGDVHVIASPSTIALPRLRSEPAIQVVESSGQTIVYLGFDQSRDDHPGIQGTNGRNPFKDRKVREAVSLAIDRDAIVERILRGGGTPAGQLLYPGGTGFVDALAPRKVDLARARALLAEAGYPNGFQVTLTVPNDRFASGIEVANAVAGLLARAGIRTTVDAPPSSVWRDRAGKGELALFMTAYGNPFPDASAPLRAITGTRSQQTGFGTQNFGGYAGPQNEQLLSTFTMVDLDRRRAVLEQVATATFGDVAVAPLYWEQVQIAALKRVGRITPRSLPTIWAYDIWQQ